jgi:hypothetical protein
VIVEELRKPAIVVVTTEFEQLAHQLAGHLGHPALRVLALPYPLDGRSTDELAAIAERAYPELLTMLGVTA